MTAPQIMTTGAVVSAEAFEQQIPVYELPYLMNLY